MDIEVWSHFTLQTIMNRSVDSGTSGCRIWQGGPYNLSKYKYGIIKSKLPGELNSKTFGVHRLAYLAHNRIVNLPPDQEISHLCHQPRCVSINHLVAEPQDVNKQRAMCLDRKKCLELHVPFCIFD